MRKLCCLAAMCSMGLPLLALDPGKTLTQYAHRIWGQEEGLLQPTIYSIRQGQNGFLWLGTQDSLIRFDGIHFREFEGAAEAGLQRTLIRSLGEDDEGNLWVASLGSGVVRIGANHEIKRFTKKEGLPEDDAFCVVPEKGGAVLVCTARGLVRISKDGAMRVYSTADGLPSNQVRDTCVAADGTRWVAGIDFGLGTWNGKQFRRALSENVSSLACTKSGAVWAGRHRVRWR